jgi:BMFP domain-containing protein YqiC
MQNQSPVIEDFARLMSGLAGTMAGMGREAEARLKEKLRDLAGGAEAVSREEFEALKALAADCRARIETLEAEIARLNSGADASDPL